MNPNKKPKYLYLYSRTYNEVLKYTFLNGEYITPKLGIKFPLTDRQKKQAFEERYIPQIYQIQHQIERRTKSMKDNYAAFKKDKEQLKLLKEKLEPLQNEYPEYCL